MSNSCFNCDGAGSVREDDGEIYMCEYCQGSGIDKEELDLLELEDQLDLLIEKEKRL